MSSIRRENISFLGKEILWKMHGWGKHRCAFVAKKKKPMLNRAGCTSDLFTMWAHSCSKAD